jgi:hypothetical protein
MPKASTIQDAIKQHFYGAFDHHSHRRKVQKKKEISTDRGDKKIQKENRLFSNLSSNLFSFSTIS